MNSAHDYESWGLIDFSKESLCEAYQGSDIVQWYGRIERQLQRMQNEAEKGRNYPAEEKLRGFLRIWRDNQLTGSINVEDLRPLEAASNILALDTNTSVASYFGSLRDNLRKLVASEEELPRNTDMDQNEPLGGGGRGGPPMSPEFGAGTMPPGAESDMPPGAEGAQPGAEGEPGAEGAPPAEGEVPPDEEPEEEAVQM